MAMASRSVYQLLRLSPGLRSRLHSVPTLTGTRTAAYWNYEWKPGQYPRSSAERDAAAKKYGLLPEDYEPYPEDEGCGDYPKLEMIGNDSKSDYEAWDIPEMKRDWGEPMHLMADSLTSDRMNPGLEKEFRYNYRQMARYLIGALATMWGISYLLKDRPYFRPMMPKQYHSEGKSHYTFSPAD